MKFKVGDVCIGQNFTKHVEANGMECAVLDISYPQGLRYVDSDVRKSLYLLPGTPVYQVLWADGLVDNCLGENLRLKRPPSWDKWIYDTELVKFEHEMSDPKKALAQLVKQQRMLNAGVNPFLL